MKLSLTDSAQLHFNEELLISTHSGLFQNVNAGVRGEAAENHPKPERLWRYVTLLSSP